MASGSARLSSALDTALATAAPDLPGLVAAVTIGDDIVYENALGVRRVGESAAMTTDTVIAIFSMTKAVTGAAAMQLVERGLIDLDAPAGTYLSDLEAPVVLEGFEADGSPTLRPAKSAVTLRNLLTHTSGYVYDIWDANLSRYAELTQSPSLFSLQKAALRVPLMFDPGTRWQYGTGIDWAGLIVEAVSGQTLGQFCQDNLFGPLAMTSTGFAPTTSMTDRMASVHGRLPGLAPLDLPPPENPEFEMGGGGLLSTVGDYLRFSRMILNGGVLDGQRLLKDETVAEMGRSNIGDLSVEALISANPMFSADADFFPGQRSTWGLTFLINESESPQGRPAGSLAWAGLANSFYWIDKVNRICGVWATQLLPFFDPAAIAGFRAFETALYANL